VQTEATAAARADGKPVSLLEMMGAPLRPNLVESKVVGGRDAMVGSYRRSYSNPALADWTQTTGGGGTTPMDAIRQLSTQGLDR